MGQSGLATMIAGASGGSAKSKSKTAAMGQKFHVYVNNINMDCEVISEADRTVRIVKGTVDKHLDTAMIIPATVEYDGVTYQVEEIGPDAFKKGASVVKFSEMIISEGIKRIGSNSLQGYTGVTKLVIPQSVEFIGHGAFLATTRFLNELNVPPTVRTIEDAAFGNWNWGVYPISTNKVGRIVSLPSYINLANCKIYGLTENAMAAYVQSNRAGTPIGANQQMAQVQQQVPVQQQVVTAPQPVAQEKKAPSSDVDVDIPEAKEAHDQLFAVIIANENYQEESDVEFAHNDGETFKAYCEKTLGIPSENIHFRKDATYNNFRAEIGWMQKVADAYQGEARFIIYYAGHGIPDESDRTSYLLPVDGKGSMPETGLSLTSFYKTLSDMPSQGITIFMDACFSGSKRGDGMMASARGVAIKAKATVPQGRMVVFSAAQGDETAYPYKDKEHGMFTYFLLKKLKESKGECKLGELDEYIKTNVQRRSILINEKSQTPLVSSSEQLRDSWQGLTLQ